MSRRRLVVLTPFAVAPPRHGPQVRVAGILANLDEDWEVTHFSQSIQRTDLPLPKRLHRGGSRWTEYRLRDPISSAWLVGMTKLGGYPAAYADRLLAMLPRTEIKRALRDADVVLVSPHYQFPWVRRHTPGATCVVVDCYCIEGEVWPARDPGWTKVVAAEIREGEKRAWAGADLVLATCEEDRLTTLRAGAREAIIVANGVDVERYQPATEDGRRAARAALGLPPRSVIAVFVGSSGYANVEAVAILEHQASEYRQAGVEVVVVGRVGVGRSPIPGVRFTGEVKDIEPWLRAADLALCPLISGSGTSLKTSEFLAAGLPLVSTTVGVRGIALRHGVDAEVAPVTEMPARVARLVADPARMRRMGRAAREVAVSQLSWRAIGHQATKQLERLAQRRDAAAPD